MRGYASENIAPGWGLQVGRVELQESAFDGCVIPECFSQAVEQCSTRQTEDVQLHRIVDSAANFSHVYLASGNLKTESANAISHFNGDFSRIRRTSSRKGILTYSISEGIRSIQVTLYRCVRQNSTLSVTPYFHPQCKPMHLNPDLVDNAYQSDCWRRYRLTVNFERVMDCLPRFVDLVIRGGHQRTLQISEVVLTGYGPTSQDTGFRQRMNLEENQATVDFEEESSIEGRSDSSSTHQYWIPALSGGVFMLLLIVAGFFISRSETAKEYIKDYIGDRYPNLYEYIYNSAQRRPSPKPRVQFLSTAP